VRAPAKNPTPASAVERGRHVLLINPAQQFQIQRIAGLGLVVVRRPIAAEERTLTPDTQLRMIRFEERALLLNRNGQRFFHPGQFHLEPANLRKQFGLTRRLRLLFTHLLPTKAAAATVEQLLLPLGDWGRMHLVFTGKLAERLLLFGCFEGEAELELSTPMLAFLGHTPSTIRYKYFTASHLSCGLVAGDNYNQGARRLAQTGIDTGAFGFAQSAGHCSCLLVTI
jgi:hypothetical protein